MRRVLALFVIACSLCACASLFPSPGEPTKKYTLTHVGDESGEAADFTTSNASRSHQLIVDLPTLYPPLDSSRVALKPQEQVIDYYADVEWADRLSALIQESLIYSLQSKRVLRGVSRPTEGIHADYALKIEVRKFYVDQPDKVHPSTAQVDYMVHLVKLPERHIVASHQFKHAQSVPEQTMDSIINSLNTAQLTVSEALVTWVLSQTH